MSNPAVVTKLTFGETTIHLLGTAHVSAQSVQEAKDLIEAVRPEVVCVELCQGRADALAKENAFRDLDVFKVIKDGKTLFLLSHLALSAYQRRMGAELGVRPGAEMIGAMEAAQAAGATVALVDRDVNTTLRRTWGNLSFWTKSRLLAELTFGGDEKGQVNAAEIERLKETKALSELLEEFSKALPEVKAPLIDERDRYMVSKIKEACVGHTNVVAVVGAAHVPGMTRAMNETINREALELIPPASLWWRIAQWAVPGILVAVMIATFFMMDAGAAARSILDWVLPTSIAAAALTALAGGRLLSVLTAFVVAPPAAIHPLIGTAMVVGLVEAYVRKPTVRDCERIPDDILTFAGFWRNPVTHILIVAVASGLGTAIGFWPGIVSYLAGIF